MDLPAIKGFREVSFSDWPGRVAAIVFLPRCNFRCPYCHNRALVLSPERYQTWPLDRILQHLDRYRGWVDGVCVSGGEPTLHTSLPHLLHSFRAAGWAVKLDSNGSRPRMLAELLDAGLVDAVSLDVKAPLEGGSYHRVSGGHGNPAEVAASLDLLLSARLPLQLRTTVHPALLSLEEVQRLAWDLGRRVAKARPTVIPEVRFDLQRCRTGEVLSPELVVQPGLHQEEFARWQECAGEAYRLGAGGLPAIS